jgi:uncharacterized protein YndB with AHSA1/START domain
MCYISLMDEGLCSIKLTRRLLCPPGEVWAAMTEPESLRRWLGDIDLHVRELEPERVLELDWRYGDEEPSVVRFELAPDGDGTVLVLDHRQIEEPVGMRYLARWTAAIGRLEAGLQAREGQ